ncbi:MAG: DUF456 domain-containing protein [Candidatus Omnitrophica bacterium]|nr:DUF456 domain-containing protein [Candidatus Omnitrophota bacterium]
MEIVAIGVLVLFSLVGFAAIFFTTFGTLIILIGSVLYAAMTDFLAVNLHTLILLLILYIIGEILEYVFVILGAKKFGASNIAAAGAIIGGILGAIFGAAFFGIGIILGTFLGIFLGAFLAEFGVQQDFIKSLKAGAGSILGRVGSIAAKIVIAFIMFGIMASSIMRYSG